MTPIEKRCPIAKSINVLLIDENKYIRDATKLKVESLKHVGSIDIAENGEQAIKKIKTSSPDIIISALEMKIMDGAQIIHEIRYNLKLSIPIIIYPSSFSYDFAIEAVLVQGASTILPVEFTEYDLETNIKKVIG